MTLPSSGPLSLGAIQGEFGGTNPASLNEYYGVAAGVPASGTISISDFYGTSSLTVTCFPGPCTAVSFGGGDAVVTLSANKSVSWSFVKVSGANVVTGPTSGPSTSVRLQPTSGNLAVYDVTANDGGSSVTKRVTLEIFFEP